MGDAATLAQAARFVQPTAALPSCLAPVPRLALAAARAVTLRAAREHADAAASPADPALAAAVRCLEVQTEKWRGLSRPCEC